MVDWSSQQSAVSTLLSHTMGVVIQKVEDRVERTEQDLTRVLELYPEYYKQFQEAQDCLMSGDGSLPLQSRHYIAFLAIRYDLPTTTTTMVSSTVSSSPD